MNKSKFFNFSITVFFGIFIVLGIVWASSYSETAKVDEDLIVKKKVCIGGECKASWPIAAIATGETVGAEVGWAKIDVGGKWYAIKLSHLGSITRVYTNTVTQDELYLSTYDDFSLGAANFCQKFGYNTSTGGYECGTISVSGKKCSPSKLNYRHNGNWGIVNIAPYGGNCNPGTNQNWCTGSQYLKWVDCIK